MEHTRPVWCLVRRESHQLSLSVSPHHTPQKATSDVLYFSVFRLLDRPRAGFVSRHGGRRQAEAGTFAVVPVCKYVFLLSFFLSVLLGGYCPMCHIVARCAIMCYAFSRSLRRLPISLRKPDAATPLGSAHLRLPPRRPLAAERLSDLFFEPEPEALK